MDEAQAGREFAALVAKEAATCLWFLRAPQSIQLHEPAATTALEAVVRHGNRQAWRRAKELQAWRSRHIK